MTTKPSCKWTSLKIIPVSFRKEVQSAHWQHAQVSLFTAALWYQASLHPIVLTSTNRTHSKDTVVAYMDRLLEEIPETVKKVSIWSDGPASQFKNRFIVSALPPLQEKHDLQITWNFFATSHGKGPVYGIGSAVKCLVWNYVRSRKDVVINATSFTTAAGQSNVKVIEMKPSEIDARNKALALDQVFKDAAPIQGIARMHYLKVVKGNIVYFTVAADANSDESDEMDEEVPSITVGDWCSVEYEGVNYPGEWKAVGADDYKVYVMVPAGKIGNCQLTLTKVVKKLNTPFTVNHRGHFNFENI